MCTFRPGLNRLPFAALRFALTAQRLRRVDPEEDVQDGQILSHKSLSPLLLSRLPFWTNEVWMPFEVLNSRLVLPA